MIFADIFFNLSKVNSIAKRHLYWEKLDIYLSLETIKHSEIFLLTSNTKQEEQKLCQQ
ncbi:hypothetical protein MNB_ARC-1_287 [hydrothermal vent metagenome]|uniref:Uncharacterized protein n=1 Tax=hydrothermal vent metagenome TaxID=652676 RepID=A0A3B1E496_9ZZZZ